MKYKVARDLPNFARQYGTISPSELANIVLRERKKQVTPESITHWFKRHPEVYSQLAKSFGNQLAKEGASKQKSGVFAELITNYGKIKIMNSETADMARKLIDLTERERAHAEARLLTEKQELEKENQTLKVRIKELEEKVSDLSNYLDSLN
jgi:hypothetical protein